MIKKNSFSIVAIFFIHNYIYDTLRLLIDEQIFLSPQVKWSVIISSKLVYTSCLTSCWKFRKLGNIKKISNLHRVIASSSVLLLKLKFCRTGKNLLKYRNWTSPVVCYLKWKIEFVSNILWIIAGRWRFSDILVSDKKISKLAFCLSVLLL